MWMISHKTDLTRLISMKTDDSVGFPRLRCSSSIVEQLYNSSCLSSWKQRWKITTVESGLWTNFSRLSLSYKAWGGRGRRRQGGRREITVKMACDHFFDVGTSTICHHSGEPLRPQNSTHQCTAVLCFGFAMQTCIAKTRVLKFCAHCESADGLCPPQSG